MFDTAHIHPILVHFPVALTLLGWLLQLVSIRRKSTWPCGEIILYFAASSAIAAATAGGLFTPNFSEPLLASAKNIHSTFAGITVTFLCAASVFYVVRRLLPRYQKLLGRIGFALYTLSAVAVAITGYLGGVLVYNDLLHM